MANKTYIFNAYIIVIFIGVFMRKVFFVVLIAIVLFFLFGCSDALNNVEDNMSDIRYNLFEAKNGSYHINFMSGLREEPYDYDGISNSLQEFGVVTVWFNLNQTAQFIPCVIKIDDVPFSCELEKNPFENNFMADIGKIVGDDNVLKVIIDGDETNSLTLVNKSKDWQIDYDEALDIGKGQIGDVIKENSLHGKICGEFYLKILYDKNRVVDAYYWYFSFLDKNNKSYSCVIDVNSGNVVAVY